MAEGDKNPRQNWDQARQQPNGAGPQGEANERDRVQERHEVEHPEQTDGRDEPPAGSGHPSDAPWLGGG
jgi:hypothetical protein